MVFGRGKCIEQLYMCVAKANLLYSRFWAMLKCNWLRPGDDAMLNGAYKQSR